MPILTFPKEVLAHLQKISRVAALCTRDISLEDEAFETDESSLALVLYNVSSTIDICILA